MPNTNPSGRSRTAVIVSTAKRARQSSGFVEIAILSLSGLTVTLLLIAQGLGLDPFLAMISQ